MFLLYHNTNYNLYFEFFNNFNDLFNAVYSRFRCKTMANIKTNEIELAGLDLA